MFRGYCCLLLVGVTLAGCETDHRETVYVLAAASTTEAIGEAAKRFEQSNPDTRILVSTGPTNALARQILSGAPADIFVSANAAWADAVVERFPQSQSIALIGNRLILIAPKDHAVNITKPADLTAPAVTRIAIAGENVPAGMYARQSLRWLGIFETLSGRNRLVHGRDVRSVLAYVHRAEVDAGIVYASDARLSDRVRVVCSLEFQSHDPIVYSAVLVKSSSPQNNRPEGAKAFFEFLQSPDAKTVFDQHDFSGLSADQRSPSLITGR